MKKILVATDGSEIANKALVRAKELGKVKDAQVGIIHVRSKIEVAPHIRTERHKIREQEDFVKHKKQSDFVLDDALEIFYGFQGEVKTISKSGDPAKEIIKEAEAGHYDLVIIGNRGLGKFSRTMLGSVSNQVLNDVKTNVLIIK